MSEGRLVYSTDPKLNQKCAKCKEVISECTCVPEHDPKTYKFIAIIRIEKQGRGGKTVTVVRGLGLAGDELTGLAKGLKVRRIRGIQRKRLKSGADDVMGDAERLPRAASPLALVVAPTRELALQVHRELEWLYAYAGARVVSCVGGMDPQREKRELEAGAHIVVGTPGRLCDHIRRKRLDVTELKAVVLDEADEMLDLGFREELETLLSATPPERRTLLFSATIANEIATLARTYRQQRSNEARI